MEVVRSKKIEGASGKNELRTVETWSILRNPLMFLASNLNTILLFAVIRLNDRSFERASSNGGTNRCWNLMLKVSLLAKIHEESNCNCKSQLRKYRNVRFYRISWPPLQLFYTMYICTRFFQIFRFRAICPSRLSYFQTSFIPISSTSTGKASPSKCFARRVD